MTKLFYNTHITSGLKIQTVFFYTNRKKSNNFVCILCFAELRLPVSFCSGDD